MARGGRVTLIILLFFGTALAYLDRQVLSLLKPTLEALFEWSDRDFAHMGSAFSLATAAAIILSGWIVDRFGVRRSYALAVVFWSIAGMAHAFATSVQQFVTARILLAVGESVNGPAAVKSAAQYLPLKMRSVALGVITSATSLGAITAPLMIPPLAVAFGWKSAFILTGALGLLWATAWWFGTRKLSPAAENAPAEVRESVGWRELFSDRRTWAILGSKVICDWVFWFTLFWTPDLFNKVFRLSQSEIGPPIALTYTMAAFGALGGGVLFPWLLKLGWSINRARKAALVIFACCIIPFWFAPQAPNAWIGALLIGTAMFAHNGFGTNVFGMITDIVPIQRLGTVMAMSSVASNLSGMAMIEFAGWSLAKGHGYGMLFSLGSVAYLLAVLWIHFMLPVIVANRE